MQPAADEYIYLALHTLSEEEEIDFKTNFLLSCGENIVREPRAK